MHADWERAARDGDVAEMRRILELDNQSPQGVTPSRGIINSKDHHGQTALMLAAARGHIAAVEFLIAVGAELNHTAKFNLSALMLAVINNHVSSVKLLVHAGADTGIEGTGAPGFFAKTALDLAQARESTELVEILSEAGRA